MQLYVAAMSSTVTVLVVVVGISTLVVWHRSDAFSSGPPLTACRSMTPSHGADPRTDPPPYVVTFSHASQGIDGNRQLDFTYKQIDFDVHRVVKEANKFCNRCSVFLDIL